MEAATTAPVAAAGRPAYAKQEYVGAVTLLHFSRDGMLLFVGVGATLYVYETPTGKLVTSYAVFSRGILHGLDHVATADGSSFTVFFGQKRLQCVLDLPETTADALAQRDDLQRAGKSKVCSDWIFDVQILSEEASSQGAFPNVAVGLAHNFVQFWNPNSGELLRTVICSERCILYSLAFYGRKTEDLLVASGTVFQKVLLWGPEGERDRADPRQRLHGHDGVIFKLEWSSDARMLASVSDDRTVQLWTNDNANEADGSTMEVDAEAFSQSRWLARPWTSRFRAWGHSARLWDVRFCSAGVVTTSEDGLCKVWALDGACVATLQGHTGKHVWRVAVHPSTRLLATGGGDGAVKIWDLEQQMTSTLASAGADCELVRLVEEAVVPVDAVPKSKKKSASLSIRDIVITRSTPKHGAFGYVAVEDGRIYELDLKEITRSRLLFSVADQLDAPSLSSFALDADERVLLVGDTSGSVLLMEIETLRVLACWKAHASRIMKVWWNEAAHGTLLTCAADGGVREWLISAHEEPVLVGDYCGPAKCAASTIAILDVAGTRNVVCGDARANVFGFARPLAAELLCVDPQSTGPSSPGFVLRGVHGRDMVATLLHDDRLVYSGGHDGYICSFLVDRVGDADHAGVIALRFVGRESVKGITTVKHLWRNENGQLMVFGFHATFAVLYNLSAQSRLFHIECGGWRRPHALLTVPRPSAALPSHTFIFTPVTKSADLFVQVHSTVCRRDVAPVVARASLHHQFHGRMATCARALGAQRLVTAGEDNALKLHRRLPVDAVTSGGGRAAAADRWTCVSTGVAHTTTIRALDAFYVAARGAHVLLSGGGKQRLNAWRVRDDLDVIEFLCGQEKADADQDHRILGLASFAAASDRERVVVACNSEGAIQLSLLDLGDAASPASPVVLRELGLCSSSKKPILSCAGLRIGGRALLAVGSTDGMVKLWDLTCVVDRVLSSNVGDDNGAALAAAIAQLEPVASYLAHDMGVNCLCVSQPRESRFRVITGGDDQTLLVKELDAASLGVVREARARNASGSALKAVAASRDGRLVYCGGYDQRVSQWRYLSDGDDASASLQWRGAAFTECADIADVDVTASGEDEDTVLVVGQGMQSVRFSAVLA